MVGAIADYSEAIRLKPDDATAYNNRGVAKDDLSDKRGAIQDYQTAVRLYQQQGNTEWLQCPQPDRKTSIRKQRVLGQAWLIKLSGLLLSTLYNNDSS